MSSIEIPTLATTLAKLAITTDEREYARILQSALEACDTIELFYNEDVITRLAQMRTHNEGIFQAFYVLHVERLLKPNTAREWKQVVLAKGAQQVNTTFQEKRFNAISAKDLLAKKLAPIEEVVDEILPAGLTLFSGKAKDGKTRAAADISLAIATNGKVFG